MVIVKNITFLTPIFFTLQSKSLLSISSTFDAAKFLLEAVEKAHNAIMETHDAASDPAGTTTLLGGVLLERRNSGRFVLIFLLI